MTAYEWRMSDCSADVCSSDLSEGTNISALCELAKTLETAHNPAALGYDCNDMNLGIAQVKYLYQLQDYVDAQEGGPGKGWFRIVSSPADARKVINDGKIAVVPGLRSDEHTSELPSLMSSS